jgi:hypothetical protein
VGDAYVLYAVVSHDGKLRHRKPAQGSGPMVYTTLSAAQRQCRSDGDSVVEMYLNLDREPLFVRKKKVNP